MSPKLNDLLMEVLGQAIEDHLNVDEMVEAVDNIIHALAMKATILAEPNDEENGYMCLLMVANQALEDGIADILAVKMAYVIQAMYEAGELPEVSMERIRNSIKEATADEQSNDPLPSTDVDELDIRDSEPEPSGVASADA